jgi:tRNA(Ile)-lysidine synthase
MNCVQKAKKMIEDRDLFAPRSRVVVAVSGGPDSVALLYIVNEIAGELSLGISAAYFDHRIRKAGARERELVEKHCNSLDIPLLAGAGDVPAEARKRKTGLEETARLLRYGFLESAAMRWEADAVALGHTRDDHVETILHHIIRGTGWRGATGIPSKRGIFVRPLLMCTRAELREFLLGRRLRYAVDESNRDNRLLRNRIRNRLLPYMRKHFNPSIDDALIRMAKNLNEGWEALERTVDTRLIWRQDGNAVQIPLDGIAGLSDFEIYLCIDMILRRIFGIVQDVDKSHFDAAKKLVRSGRSGTKVQFPQGITCIREQREIRLSRVREKSILPDDVVIPRSGTYTLPAWNLSIRIEQVARPAGDVESNGDEIYAAGVTFPLRIRTRRAGDRIQPFGMRGRKKLSDVLIDRKVPLHRRDTVPIFEDAGGIFWVPGVVAGERTRIETGQRTVLHISLEREK